MEIEETISSGETERSSVSDHRKKRSTKDKEKKKKEKGRRKKKKKSKKTDDIDETPKIDRFAKYSLDEEEKKALYAHLKPPVEEFTEEELVKLQQFKEAVADTVQKYTYDAWYRRWLAARDWDVKAASDMYRKAMEWKVREGVNDILETFPKTRFCQLCLDYWPNNILNVRTKDGFPVVLEELGQIDSHFLDVIPKEQFVRFHIYEMELALWHNYLDSKERRVSAGSVMIEDLSGIGWGHYYGLAVSALKEMGAIDNDYYPEGLRKFYFVNAPGLFTALWKIAKMWYDPNTIAKMEIHGSIPTKTLQAIIPLDELPVKYGGTSDLTVPVPCSVKSLKAASESEHERHFKVARGSTFTEKVMLEQGQTLSWEFSTKSYDIGFVLVEPESSSPDPSSPEPAEIPRFPSHKHLVVGFHTATQSGVHKITFNNSYSWSRSKSVRCRFFIDLEEHPRSEAISES